MQEYWIVSWHLKTLKIYRRAEAQVQLVRTLLEGDALNSPYIARF
ncbi:Uma2 family endonuclease [Phormidium tenue]|nr:Uma2 family endonuclease [Phormidium tenue]